jgi:3-oxoacyl-[acyl-carrier protein] reductase
MPLLDGSVAIVTGGGRGVGRAIAGALGDGGAAVAVWSRTAGEVERVAAELGGIGARAVPLSVDVTDEQAVADAARIVADRLGPVDLLVNAAGTMAAVGVPWAVSPDAWWQDVETSLRGSFLAARAVLPGMLARRNGRIVNIASNVAVRPSPYQSGYAAAKAGVLSLTEALAAAVAEHGVSVFAVSPGYVLTEMTRRMHDVAAGEPWADSLGSGEPLDPDRAARLVVFLAAGRGDALSGRYFHALDDFEDLARRADEVVRDDLYVPRLRTLNP